MLFLSVLRSLSKQPSYKVVGISVAMKGNARSGNLIERTNHIHKKNNSSKVTIAKS